MARHRSTAYVDESQRPGRDLLTVVVVGASHQPRARQHLCGLRLRNEAQIHFAHSSDRRRRQLLAAMAEIEAVAVTLVVRSATGRSARQARDLLVQAAAVEAAALGAEGLVLERRTPAEDQRDRQSLARTKTVLTYEHANPREEPLLWLPDAIGWCVGRGRDWPQRLAPRWRATKPVRWE